MLEMDLGNLNSLIFLVLIILWLLVLLVLVMVVWVFGELSFIRDVGVVGDVMLGLGG